MTTTGLPDTPQLIKDYVYKDGYNRTYYKALTKSVHDICEEKLEPTGIQAFITSRAKKKESLERKLCKMNEDRRERGLDPFQTRQEIESCLFDLAGIRIALYVPHQRETIRKEIKKWGFADVDWIEKRGKIPDVYLCKCGKQLEEKKCFSCRRASGKEFTTGAADTRLHLAEVFGVDSSKVEAPSTESANPEASNSSDRDAIYNPIFAGYVADHARVKLSERQRSELKLDDWRPEQVVEIQVVSVLMHAWAEVEHGIQYKEIKAKADREEKQLLDSLNGTLRACEVLLDQIHTIHEKRKGPFANKFELAVFLIQYIGPEVLNDQGKNNLELKMLFSLLKAVGKDSHSELHPILLRLGFKENKLTRRSELRSRYTDLDSAEEPFPLHPSMYLPFYIMESIVSQLTPEEERQAQLNAGEGNALGSEDNLSYKCRVLLSSFVWMGQLYRGGNAFKAMAVIESKDEKEKSAFNWPFTSPLRFKILVGEKASARDIEAMDLLWEWFAKQKGSFFSFVFRISRMGAIASFPDDLAHLRK